jgi:hypothetical protein
MTTDRPIPQRPNVNARRAAPERTVADELFDEPTPSQAARATSAPAAPVTEAARSISAPTTFTIDALLDDFPIDVSFSGDAERLAKTIARLRQIGAIPPSPAARAAAAAEHSREAPICPYHGPMKESAKAPGTYFCSKKMETATTAKRRRSRCACKICTRLVHWRHACVANCRERS